MSRNAIVFGLLASLLLLAACAPTAADIAVDEAGAIDPADVDVLVYASPL